MSTEYGTQGHTGFPSPATEYLEPPISLNDIANVNSPSTFLMRVEGDVVDCDLADGDILIIDRKLNPRDGDIIVAVADGEIVISRFKPRTEYELWGAVRGILRLLRDT